MFQRKTGCNYEGEEDVRTPALPSCQSMPSFFPKPLRWSNLLFLKHLSLFFLQHHCLHVLVIPHCHYVFRLFFILAPSSYNNSWTEPGFNDCRMSSGYFRSLHVNSSNWAVDSESQCNHIAKEAATKPGFLLSADLACATLPNPLFVWIVF